MSNQMLVAHKAVGSRLAEGCTTLLEFFRQLEGQLTFSEAVLRSLKESASLEAAEELERLS